MVLSELVCAGTMETLFWARIGAVKGSKGEEVPALPSGTGTLNTRLAFLFSFLPILGWFGGPHHTLSAPECVPHSPIGRRADTSTQAWRGARSHRVPLLPQRPTGRFSP